MKNVYSITLFLVLSICAYSQTVNFTSSNLPIVIINTNGQTIPDEPKIMADMGIIYNGVGVRNNVTDPRNHYNGKIGIEVRGQSSQSFPMKSYSVDLWNASGNGINQALLGMPSESDWVLYAPYTDKTLMRNVLAYEMSRSLGHWAANCRFVEVVLNGGYVGVYVLMEKIKRKATRVNISSISATDITGSAVTGGYIFSLDKEPNGWFSNYLPIVSSGGQRIQYSHVYPKIENIVVAQQNYLKSYVDSFEKALYLKTGDYKNFININTFVDFFLVNEVSRNVDGLRLSTYYNKDRNGKINAGPVWDFDLAFRNANYCNGSSTSGWAYQFEQQCPNDFFQMPFWWKHLMQDTAFKSRLKCRYDDVKNQQLQINTFTKFIDSCNILLGEAQQRHFTRWPILGTYVWPNPQPIANSYTDELRYLKQWLTDRLLWLNNNIPNEGSCAVLANDVLDIKILANPTGSNVNYNVKTGVNRSITIKQHNINGQLIYSYEIVAARGISNYSFTNKAPGLSIISFYTNGKKLNSFKIIK